MTALEITGNLRKRFMRDAVLLHFLDPVRGSPTTYGLDRHPHDTDASREILLKRKFLDSVALLASTHKDGDRVSAATIEEGSPEGTIVRIASNAGVCDSTLLRLQDLVRELNDVSATATTPKRKPEILSKIISLDIQKIRHYFAKLRRVRSETSDIENIEKILPQLASTLEPVEVQPFSLWMSNLAVITAVSADASPSQLMPHIMWAEQAKWKYSNFLETVFSIQGSRLPSWIYNIYKLGRYAVASRALCQLATECPALFCPMRVDTVHSPAKLAFSIPSTERPLSQVLRRVVGDREEELASRLAAIWGISNPEVCFSGACHLRQAVHAEMQLVSFYDQNPELTPSFRFMGVSKKSCYLCQIFLSSHPLSFTVSSCHQKLYLTWRPPPSTKAKTYKAYKSIVTNLCKLMESTARQELKGRLGSNRSIPLDSTAGVSLSGLTDYNPMRSEAAPIISYDTHSTDVSGSEDHETAGAPLRLDGVTSPNSDVAFVPTRTSGGHKLCSPPLIFNVVRADSVSRRDLISLEDITDSTQKPSWGVFVEILSGSDQFGVCYDVEKEFLTVNDSLRVGNERQFHACLQFLRNLDCHNVSVTVQTYASLDQ
ncbi:hypothetical protein N8I77_013371 [Diaporthe amygdali]|uniref:Uncharacterized protein n=1 Tax=Phomopsis amygdali TaxID=1214568 RepID=A0AAD9VYV1_PHOAM|nr:hypothetical protein N8I77_013371 [Diaporthe amygdali]